jgi:excinuclease ABC subunit A
VLSVEYKGLSIKEVLKLSVEEAAECFAEQPKIMRILKLLQDVGLGYLELGQTLTTLSGGEGQRLKLAKELIGSGRDKKCLYLLDEPTTGLHPVDVDYFLVLLNTMVEAGNTVVVVEHNQQLIGNSDYVIDLGPEGGEKGGEIVFTGRPVDKK